MKCWLTLDWYPKEEENQFDKCVSLHFTCPTHNFRECENGRKIWEFDDHHSIEIMYISDIKEDFPIDLFNLIKNSPNFETFCTGEDPIELDLSLFQITSCVKSCSSDKKLESIFSTELKSVI